MDKFLKIAFSALCLLVGTAVALAQTAGVSMTKFEQTFLDSQAAIALRNNLPDTVYSVTYSLEFLSSKGVPEDFQEYTSKVTIPPGMTKKVEIPAYCHDRNYEYYKTLQGSGIYPTFKVNYKYISADTVGPKKVQTRAMAADAAATATDSSDAPQQHGISDIVMCIGILFAITFVIGMYVLVAQMARNRGRNAAVWVALSLFLSPLLVMFILLIAGKSNNYYR